jgi:glycosyltransferase involved in cell wall biosynthesis
MPLDDITVVIPLYNNEGEIVRAIRSVLAQSCPPAEIIVVDDGSTDSSADEVKQFNDVRIRYIAQANSGVSAARNSGISAASHGLIAFLDADDEWKPDFLDTILRLVESHPSCSIFATSYLYCDSSSLMRAPILRGVPSKEWAGELSDYFSVASASDPPLWSSAIVIRRDALTSIGGFPVGIKSGEDLLTWARLALEFKIAYNTRACSLFHLSGEIAGNPTRVPETPDLVGAALHGLAQTVDGSKRRQFRTYVAFWHRMRVAMFLQLNMRAQAFSDLYWMARYNGLSPQLYLYLCLWLLPARVREKALKCLASFKIRRRQIRAHE